MKRVLGANLARHVTLLRTFAVCSALIMALIGVLLAANLQRVTEAIVLRQEITVATAQAETLLHGGRLLNGSRATLSRDAIRYLASVARQSVASGLYVRVKIWGRDGTVLFSNEPALINHRFPIDDDLADVLRGTRPNAADISNLSAQENRAERRFHHLLEVYVPIRNGRHIVGAFELYQSMAGLDAAEAEVDTAIWLSVSVGFLILYLSLFLIVRNASQRLLRQGRALEHQAFHDVLTDLPNRVLLHRRLDQLLQATRHKGAAGSLPPTTLLLLDLDRFKEVNDTFGHHYGDLLLQEVGRRLRSVCPVQATVARLGGDEFAILLPDTGMAEAHNVARAILHALEQPCNLDGYSVFCSASIGIVSAPRHGDEALTLLRRADIAMYAAKRAVSGYDVYDPSQDQSSPERVALLGDLRQAIDQQHLVLHFQPKVDLRSGTLDGIEALVRWQHPTRGLLGPQEFIPLVEHTGLLAPLTRWVVMAALQEGRAWYEAAHPLRVAVNLSARSLHHTHLADMLAEGLRQYGVPPHLLTLEITESAVMHDPDRAMELIDRLHRMGVRLSIDDFGTGYSSLAYLKHLQVDELKIDKSFVRDMHANANDVAIVRSIINLGQALGLKVIAEGVETRATMEHLRAMGCDIVQGYYLSRPLPAEDLRTWVRDQQRNIRQAG